MISAPSEAFPTPSAASSSSHATRANFRPSKRFREEAKTTASKGLRSSAKRKLARWNRAQAVGALFSPETGILDSHALMLALRGDAADSSAVFAFRTPFLRARLESHAVRISAGGREPTAATARVMVNCAGLNASAVARAVEGADACERSGHAIRQGQLFRTWRPRSVRTSDLSGAAGARSRGAFDFRLAGQARFGPDVEWVDAIDYGVNPARSEGFVAAIRRYWPGLPNRALTPAYSGIRPKLGGPNDPAADFRIEAQTFGDAMLVNLFGIESPGLTSSLAIAGHVLSLVG